MSYALCGATELTLVCVSVWYAIVLVFQKGT